MIIAGSVSNEEAKEIFGEWISPASRGSLYEYAGGEAASSRWLARTTSAALPTRC